MNEAAPTTHARDRRAFPRHLFIESIKVQLLDNGSGGGGTVLGSTTDISRGGVAAVLEGRPLRPRERCVVRFPSTIGVDPVMCWGTVMGVDDTAQGRVARIEFDTPLATVAADRSAELLPDQTASVLVVDDDRHICDVLSRYLSREGYEVTVAANGATGVGALQRRDYDAMLLDIYMPGLDGFGVLRRIRDLGVRPRVVLTISGYDDSTTAQRSLDLGADDFLLKPLELSYLGLALKARLSATQAVC